MHVCVKAEEHTYSKRTCLYYFQSQEGNISVSTF